MFGHKIVRTIADNDRCVANVEALRENIGQIDFLFRIRRSRSQRLFLRVHHDPRRMNVGILDCGRNPVPEQREQSVVDPGKIEIDRLNIARSSGSRVQVPDDEVRENATLDPKFKFQIFLRRIMQSDAMPQA